MDSLIGNSLLSSLRPGGGLRHMDVSAGQQEISMLSMALEKWITEEGWAFSCQGITLAAEEMAAANGLLPIVLQQAQYCLARATGASPPRAVLHDEIETGLCGVSVTHIDGLSMAQMLLLGSYALEEHANRHNKESPIPIDIWYETWNKTMAEGLVEVRPLQVSAPSASIRS